MPLHPGHSESALRTNIATEIRSGRSTSQAVAMSLRSARASWRRSHPKGPFPHHLRGTGGYRASRSNRAGSTRAIYTVMAGRQIYRDGRPFVSIGREGDTHPTEADALVHEVANYLNKRRR